ncbi:hypothetical protein [Sulfitobacter pacificus]|uniref:Uncharacterized protein n=1 Tax=Sulfitobacter pacificus TaxID=1499314 RepID=A0ABQ5VF91_9RHOB|nr:hypothetical protein [Sulfitobacter pacificus]GLQ25727.1 hypothetical protein GCM10007927_05300 [Sulfitobacter pacificus]
MGILLKTQTLAAVVALASALPMAVQADGHSDAYVGAKGYVGEVAVRPTKQYYPKDRSNGSQPKRVRSTVRYTVPGCPPKFNGMYRGTLYCVDGRPID